MMRAETGLLPSSKLFRSSRNIFEDQSFWNLSLLCMKDQLRLKFLLANLQVTLAPEHLMETALNSLQKYVAFLVSALIKQRGRLLQ